ncbi:MAG: ABC transporter permease subunit [Fuerstiella sp.]|nr:ABC transporter permease subunit [Fuerstiella sp.]MCP4787556.1 ABC transporter permease subunit [Fuerstiella sp.]MCP4858833.1 ABC transporter permease subunit [Fuerstiella sp.]
MKGILAIVERELPSLLRTKQTLWIFVIVALTFSATVLLKWPSTSTADLSGVQARAVFRGLAYSMFVTVVLVVPAFPATGLIREVRRRTMELLLNSPLRRSEIFVGKLVALAAFAMVLLTVTLPAMACCYAMGAISPTDDVLGLYGLLGVICVELIVLGLLVGTIAETAESGLRWVYGATFSLTVIAVIPHIFLQGGDSIYAVIASHMRTLSPIPALLQLVGDATPGATGAIVSEDLIWPYVFSALVLSLVGSVICIRRLNYSLMDRSRSQGIITDERSASLQVARRMMYLVDPQKRKSGIAWFLNPVMIKEFRSRQFGRLHWLLRMVAGCAVMSLLLTLATTMGTLDWGVEKVGGIMIVAQVGLILVLTPGISGAMIAGEMESGGWDMLRATPLSTHRVLTGKLMSVSVTLALVLCASLPGYGIIMVIKPVLQTQVVQVIVSLALTAAVAMLISATVSSFLRSTAAATTVSYGLLIFLYAGSMLVWVNRDSPFSHAVVERVLSVNAMAGALNAMEVDGFQMYDGLLRTTWVVSGVMCGVILLVLSVRTWRIWEPD